MRCQQNHKEILEQAIAEETYTEEAPITEAFERLLDLLGLGAVDTAENGKQLWYNDEFYRYGLYINTN